MGRRADSGVTGILVIDKPAGMSSHAVVARVRKWYQTSKVGHAGTLDPMATGVLVLGLGKGTKLLTYLVGADKTYTAVIRLGASTPTDDADSQPDTFAPPGALEALTAGAGSVAEAAATLTGTIEQVPSAVSAIKVDGKRAYDLVRAGHNVDLKARTVTVSRFEVGQPVAVHGEHPYLDVPVTVDCSSGTYIRALARDLGQHLGVYGHLTQLRRQRVGPFAVSDAVDLPEDLTGTPTVPVRGLATVASAIMPTWELTAGQARDLAQGKFVDSSQCAQAGGVCAAVFQGMLVAVCEPRASGKAASGAQLKVATGFATPTDIRNLEYNHL